MKKIVRNPVVAYVAIFVFATNVTLLILTLHALTEVTVVFLLTLYAALTVHKADLSDFCYWFPIIFLSSLLAVTKPLYIILVAGILLYKFPSFVAKFLKREYSPVWVVYLLLALSPVFIQLAIMKTKHDSFSISRIGELTTRNWYFSAVYSAINDLSWQQARDEVQDFSPSDMMQFLTNHPTVAIRKFGTIIVNQNLKTGSNFVGFPTKHARLGKYQYEVNSWYYRAHRIMFWIFPVILVILIIAKQWSEVEKAGLLAFPFALIVFTSGVSFWQGDRLVLPSLPLWITLYSLLLALLWQLLLRKIRSALQRPSECGG